MSSTRFTAEYRPPELTDVVDQQLYAQYSKPRGRTLINYEECLFEEELYRREPMMEDSPFMKFLYADLPVVERSPNLGVLLDAMAQQRGRAVRWVDMGSGYATALRQFGQTYPALSHTVSLSGVDVHYPHLLDLPEARVIGDPRRPSSPLSPGYIKADITHVQLDAPADLITSIESLQYLDDPLGAICNWYNQLADDGVLYITTTDILSHFHFNQEEPTANPLQLLLRVLEQAGIEVVRRCDPKQLFDGCWIWLEEAKFSALAIRRTSQTSLKLDTEVQYVGVRHQGFKDVFYRPTNQPVLVDATERDRADF